MNTETTDSGADVTILLDGRARASHFTILSGSWERGILTLAGPRGGQRGLVRNLHTGRWYLTTDRRSDLVSEIDGAQV